MIKSNYVHIDVGLIQRCHYNDIANVIENTLSYCDELRILTNDLHTLARIHRHLYMVYKIG